LNPTNKNKFILEP